MYKSITKTLKPKASVKFKKLLLIRNIKKTYEKEISWKDIRGVDRLSIRQFEKTKELQFRIIRKKCLNSSYNFSPYLERLRPKGRNRPPRVISLATVRDRIVLAILKNYLHYVFPECVNRTLPNTHINAIKEFYRSNTSDTICVYCNASLKSYH